LFVHDPNADGAVAVAFPGRDGAHSAFACAKLFPAVADRRALPSFSAVADAVAAGTVHFGVLPIESSLSGSVGETHDLLHGSPLSIWGETTLLIRHCLVGPAEASLEQIKVIHSHPVALDQCRRLLAEMPWAIPTAAATTADAAAAVVRRGPEEAAIASEHAARLHGLRVLVRDVGDQPASFTRFVSIANRVRLDGLGTLWRTAFSFVTDHQPGALHCAIEPLARHAIDLVQLVSRPLPSSPWRYRFDAVLDGHPLETAVQSALANMMASTRSLRVFGSYPACQGG
jgi:prephenate dehydratase